LIETAEAKSFEIDVVPFIRILPIQSGDLSNLIRELSLQSLTAVFTSMNAAETVIKELNGAKPLWTLFCIGSATRDTLIQYFGEQAIVGFANNASKLAYTIAEAGNVKEAVFFCGDQRRDELPMILEEKKIKVREVIVYKTILIDNKISENYHGILFFSPSAVSSFFTNNAIDPRTVVFAIGDTTAAVIKKYVENTMVISEGAGKENLVRAMIDYFEAGNQETVNN
jgi:uroporphyrinogen-III synthase